LKQQAAAARTIERLRGLVRDIARLEAAAAVAASRETAGAVQAATDAVAASLHEWNDLLGRPHPNPVLFDLAGEVVVRSQAAHQAALLDRNIAEARLQSATGALALAEAKMEASRLSARAILQARQRKSDELVSLEAEDMFLRRGKQ
jgi:hypothetical protein